MKGAYINIKLIIGNRDPGTGSLFLLWVNVWNISKLLIGNRELETWNYFLVSYCGIQSQSF